MICGLYSLWCKNGVLEPGDIVYDVGVHSRDPGFSTPNTPAEEMKRKIESIYNADKLSLTSYATSLDLRVKSYERCAYCKEGFKDIFID